MHRALCRPNHPIGQAYCDPHADGLQGYSAAPPIQAREGARSFSIAALSGLPENRVSSLRYRGRLRRTAMRRHLRINRASAMLDPILSTAAGMTPSEMRYRL